MTVNDDTRLAFLGEVFDLRGRSALVTGAGSGIGQAIATALARAGASVAFADINLQQVTAVTDALAAEGLTVTPVVVDVGEKEQIAAALDQAEAAHGPIDVVFANAGISGGKGPLYGGRIEDVPSEIWDAALRVNLNGVFHTMQAAAGRMRGRGGRIIATASIAGMRGDTMVGYAYAASKAAVINLVRQAALDLADDAVLVNAILPGPFTTSIGAPAGSPQKIAMDKQFAETVPLGRVASTDEMRGIALFLASPASSFVTGETFAIDGGSLAGRFEPLSSTPA
jgi:NAD(P)-dependent dehydrogenase (short-subunit alcohol dehydrogenase family)